MFTRHYISHRSAALEEDKILVEGRTIVEHTIPLAHAVLTVVPRLRERPDFRGGEQGRGKNTLAARH